MPKYYSKLINGSFQIQKTINKKRYNFGTYKTEEEAQERVEFLKEHDWSTWNYPKHVFKHYYATQDGKYMVCKMINGRVYNFGRYPTEKEAMGMVAFLKQHDWDLKYAHIRNPEMKYIVKVRGKYQIHHINNDTGKLEHYGTFNTLEDAQKERDLLVSCNWDWNLICDGGL